MWKCIRCEKENKDIAEICAECGHGKTMDYMRHRTLAKIPAKLAKNWKISRNTEKEIEKLNNENRKKIQDLKKKYRQTQLQAKKDAAKEIPNENRKNAEEFIQKKLSSLRSSVISMKDEISKGQDEINELHVVVEEQNKLIAKDAKADEKITTIAAIIAATIIIALLGYIVYRYGFDGRWSAVEEYVNLGKWTAPIVVLAIAACEIELVSELGNYSVFDIFVRIIDLLIGGFIRTVSDETLKQAKTERDNAQKSIDEKKNKINCIQSNAKQMEHQIQRIENNREQIKDRLSMVSLEKMNEEFECLMRI